ncbi:MAG: hypothetical protein KA132_11330 [Thauera sp.]|nr:hypothetical protein [Thauera sp.]
MKSAQVRHRLLKATGLTYRQWAMQRNINPRTVTQTVSRWAGRSDLPRGRKSFAILRELSREIGREIVPGVLEEVA